MRYVEDIGTEGDFIERRVNAPRLYRCPQCRRKGRRASTTTRQVAHVRVLNRRSWIGGEVGVYKARCGCSKYFQAPIPGMPVRGQYSYEVRNAVANALIRDRLPYRLVQQLYKDSLQSHWVDIVHQLCIFHVIKEVNKLILDGVRAIKNGLRRQGNKGRKKRPGRPGRKAQQQRQRRQGLSKKAQATFIWEHQHLIVRKQAELTDEEKEDLTLMLLIAPELELFRRFNQQFYRLFEKGLSQQAARYRRTRLVNNPAYQANPFLARAMKKLAKEKYEKMIAFLGWENVGCTNNHVERNNRGFRMMQKTRYKRRKTHTLEKAVELELYARMMQHPLYQAELKELPVTLAEPSRLKKAA